MPRTYQATFSALGNPIELIDLADQHFSALGYVRETKSANKLRLKKDGSYWTFDAHKVKHHLEVCATGVALVFDFIAPWGSVWTKGDGPKLDAIAGGFVGAVRALPSRAPGAPVHVVVQQHSAPAPAQQIIERQVVVARCKYCQKLAAADVENCQHCGAAKFC